jgi:hypothetical protein
MPGTIWSVHCPDCGRSSEIMDGVGRARSGVGLSGCAQYGCAACGALQTVRTVEGQAPAAGTCRNCGGELTPWAGLAGHHGSTPSADHAHVNQLLVEKGREPIGQLVCQGPCPRCGAELETSRTGLWD